MKLGNQGGEHGGCFFKPSTYDVTKRVENVSYLSQITQVQYSFDNLELNYRLVFTCYGLGAVHLLRNTISDLSGPPPPLCCSVSAFGLPPLPPPWHNKWIEIHPIVNFT